MIPTAKALYLREEIDVESGAFNLYALFNALNAEAFPDVASPFAAFAQLTGGLGEMTAHCDIIRARDDRVVYVSETHHLRFDRRAQTLRVSLTFHGVRFEEPGVYFVQLLCDNAWVADATLEVGEIG